MSVKRPNAGWVSPLPEFRDAEPRVVCSRLRDFVGHVQDEQERAWATWVPALQQEAMRLLQRHELSQTYDTILEYRLPRDHRRPDLIVLENGVVVVVELKGGSKPTRAGLDQVLAYVRDLRAYHAMCHDRPVVPVLVPRQAGPEAVLTQGVWVVGPLGLHATLEQLSSLGRPPALDALKFVDDEQYEPLPSIVQAARRLFTDGNLPMIKRAAAATKPALTAVKAIAEEAAATSTRHLVVLTGVPGSGKTLVGLQLAHASWLDHLVVPRAGGTRRVPAVYLSGNAPLVEVMQYSLRQAGGGGQTFVRHVKPYIEQYTRRPDAAPPEHLVVFDEAQRAYDAVRTDDVNQVATTGETEPEHLLRALGRVPEWAVLVALVGEGQVLHNGEEGGLRMWRDALAGAGDEWIVHAPPHVCAELEGSDCALRSSISLNLDKEIRYHLVPKVHEWVRCVLDQADAAQASSVAASDLHAPYTIRVTRHLDAAKAYLRERYQDGDTFRYGILVSSRDKILARYGVDNSFQTLKRMRTGPWIVDAPQSRASCCRLEMAANEFRIQGLELDMGLVAWGTDLIRETGVWTNRFAVRHRKPAKDPLALRRNAYRVLLTRGRDGNIIYVPDDRQLDETVDFLLRSGAQVLDV